MGIVSAVTAAFSNTTEFLLRRLRIADSKWESALRHRGYRDDRDDHPPEKPFTPEDHQRYWWADTWRLEFHWLESELYKQRDVRLGMVEGLSIREPLVVYEPI